VCLDTCSLIDMKTCYEFPVATDRMIEVRFLTGAWIVPIPVLDPMQPYWLMVVGGKADVTLPSNAEFTHGLSFTNSLSNMGSMEMVAMYSYVFFCTFVCLFCAVLKCNMARYRPTLAHNGECKVICCR
jgi:hypothetical protein